MHSAILSSSHSGVTDDKNEMKSCRVELSALGSAALQLSACRPAESVAEFHTRPAQCCLCRGNGSARLIHINCGAERGFPCTWLHSQIGSPVTRGNVIQSLCELAALDHVPTQVRQILLNVLHFFIVCCFCKLKMFIVHLFCVQLPTMETCIYLEGTMLIWIDTSMTSGNLLQVIFSFWG